MYHPLDPERPLGRSNCSRRLLVAGELEGKAIGSIALLIDLIGQGRYQCLVVLRTYGTSAGMCDESLSSRNLLLVLGFRYVETSIV